MARQGAGGRDYRGAPILVLRGRDGAQNGETRQPGPYGRAGQKKVFKQLKRLNPALGEPFGMPSRQVAGQSGIASTQVHHVEAVRVVGIWVPIEEGDGGLAGGRSERERELLPCLHVVGGCSEFTAVSFRTPFTRTLTVLLEPRIPPGSLTLPTQKVSW